MLNDGSGVIHESHFVWADGTPVTFTDWLTGEPNNSGSSEYNTALRGPLDSPLGAWNDIPNSGGGTIGGVFGVVEIVPEPQVYAYLLVSVVAFIVFRRKPSAAR